MAAGCASPSAIPTSALLLCGKFRRREEPAPGIAGLEQALAGVWWNLDTGWKYSLFESTRDHTQNIWALREATSLLRDLFRKADTEPTQLTVGPLLFSNPTLSPDGKKLFVIGQQRRFDLIQLDGKSNNSLSICRAYRRGRPIRRATASDRLCVESRPRRCGAASGPELRVCNSRTRRCSRTCRAGPRRSPDRIHGVTSGKAMEDICDAAEGGTPREVTPEDHNQGDPTWMPKATQLSLQACRGWITENFWPNIHIAHVNSAQVSDVPDSENRFQSRCSRDGR